MTISLEQFVKALEDRADEVLDEEDDRDQELRARILIDISSVLSRIQEEEETIEVYA